LASCFFTQDVLTLHSSAVVNCCNASVCCRLSFLLIAMLDVIALISSTILYYRTRHIYKIEHQELHQHDEDMQHPHSIPNFPTGGANMGHVSSVSDLETMS